MKTIEFNASLCVASPTFSEAVWKLRSQRLRNAANWRWKMPNSASESWKKLFREPNRIWHCKSANTRNLWMLSWLWTLKLLHTGNCWKERRTGHLRAPKLCYILQSNILVLFYLFLSFIYYFFLPKGWQLEFRPLCPSRLVSSCICATISISALLILAI